MGASRRVLNEDFLLLLENRDTPLILRLFRNSACPTTPQPSTNVGAHATGPNCFQGGPASLHLPPATITT